MWINRMKANGKRLYFDVAMWGAKTNYVIVNGDLLPMVCKYFNLSKLESDIFFYICQKYDNPSKSNYEPLRLSYGDIASKLNCSYSGAIKSLRNLIERDKLILCVDDKRMGRSKKQYLPNTELIHMRLKEYVTSD